MGRPSRKPKNPKRCSWSITRATGANEYEPRRHEEHGVSFFASVPSVSPWFVIKEDVMRRALLAIIGLVTLVQVSGYGQAARLHPHRIAVFGSSVANGRGDEF